jgi:prepilin-type N-terminal cleavage/methylation domain-containing protein
MKLSRSKGFTLVEIMIVVAIIGIIIAIAVPAFLRARENSRGQACQENLSKIDGAKEQYALEFRLANGSAVTMAQLITPGGSSAGQGYLRDTPRCPSSGTYSVNNIGTAPTCSIGTSNSPFIPHVLPQ